MRCFYNLAPQRQKELRDLFPDMLQEDFGYRDTTKGYNDCSISVFDHWLVEGEGIELLHQVPLEEQRWRDTKHRKFLDILFDETEVLTYQLRSKRKDRVAFKKFASLRAYQCKTQSFLGDFPEDQSILCNRHDWRIGWLKHSVVLPEFKAVYCWGYDDTNHLFYRDTRLSSRLVEWVEESGLHILE